MGRIRTVEHWWNGTWGRLARKDVWLRTDDGGRWDVWVREGGADTGKNRHREHDDEDSARAELAAEMDPRFEWRRLDQQ